MALFLAVWNMFCCGADLHLQLIINWLWISRGPISKVIPLENPVEPWKHEGLRTRLGVVRNKSRYWYWTVTRTFCTVTKKKCPTLIFDQRRCVCVFWNLVFCEMFLCFDPEGHPTMFCSVVAVNYKETERNAFTPSRWKIQSTQHDTAKRWKVFCLLRCGYLQIFDFNISKILAPYVYQRAVWFSISSPDLWPLNRQMWNFYVYNSLIKSPYKIII